MPRLNMGSQGPRLKCSLGEEHFLDIERILNVGLDEEKRLRLQGIIDNYLMWPDFDADASPVIKYFDDAHRALKQAHTILNAGPKSSDDDVNDAPSVIYREVRRTRAHKDTLADLVVLVGFAAADMREAAQLTKDKWSSPSPKGSANNTSEGYDRLIAKLADFAEAIGIAAEANDSFRRAEQNDFAPKAGRHSAFVKFVDCITQLLPDGAPLPTSGADAGSTVNRVLKERKAGRFGFQTEEHVQTE